MLARAVFVVLVASAWGFGSPHREAFLSAAPADQEVMSANMNFAPMSTTMECILNLTLQYIVILTALGICRTVLDFQQVRHSSSALQTSLKHASETVFYAPMVCLLFIGFRMRMLQLTKGTGAPQDYVQFAMKAVTYAILANTLCVLVVPIFTDTPLQLESTGEVKTSQSNPFASQPILKHIFDGLRYLIVLGLYGGMGTVLVGLFLFAPPAGVWDGPIPPVSPAVGCTASLTCAFFLVYLGQALARTYSQHVGGNAHVSKVELTMTRAADTLGMAPMLCALFLAARMRALQMDPVNGNPQRWAQNCFYLCSGALVAQTCVSILVPLLLNGEARKPKADDPEAIRVEGDMEFSIEGDEKGESFLSKGLTVFRFCIMLSVYLGATAVVCSVFTIEHPQGKELTPPLSPTMQCVLNLAFQYFLVYLLVWVFITVEDFTSIDLDHAKQAVESAKATVMFAPMLAVLFIATRMRALQMTDNQGAPQGWVQDGMYLATWSILIQFLMCLIMPFFTGKPYTPDTLEGPAAKKKETNVENHWGAMAITFVRYAALVALIGGIATVAVGVFTMTPETANGRGSIPLITDGTLPVDLAPQPPGINDVPGAKTAMKGVGETVGTGVDAVDKGVDTVAAPVAEAADKGVETVAGAA